jgi:queuine tRNA-ribosyltransferase
MIPTSIQIREINIETPVFLPDATLGVVRSLDATDLLACHIQAVVMNTFHLMQHPGSSTIRSLGGLHKFAGWSGPIVTDSGGFQAYSLIHQNPKFGSISDKGITFQPEGSSRKYQLTPEKCIRLQYAYGSDVIICLDDCTHVDASREEQEASVRRTIAWARRGKAEYSRLVESSRLSDGNRPFLFAVVQGGGYLDLRKACAQALLEIGFDGFGYGGWPLDSDGSLLADLIGYTRQIIPPIYPMHALGVGHPANVVACYRLGYILFDSAMPTRDARHGRLCALTQPLSTGSLASSGSIWERFSGEWLDYVYIGDEKHTRSNHPVSPGCDCLCCRRYSLGYLHHLFKINDSLFFRLATIHNLRFMTQLTEYLHACSLIEAIQPLSQQDNFRET